MSDAAPLRVGVVGLGFGANHARILAGLDGVCLAAVCDKDNDRLAAVAGAASSYDDYDAMLRESRLDAVIVAVPTHLHEEVARAAIASGAAVLVEKPLAPSLAAGRRLVETAAAASVPLMPGHVERFNPAVKELTRRVHAGELGDVIQVTVRRLAYFLPRTRNVDVGVIHDLAYHDIDIARFLLCAPVRRVYAETRSRLRTPYDDALSCLLRFESANGADGPVCTIEVNWLSPRKVRELSVLGERGLLSASYADFRAATLEFQEAQTLDEVVSFGSDEAALINLRGGEPGAPVGTPIEAREPLQDELAAFVAALRAGGPMPVSGDDALAALAVADALAESARTGAAVRPAPAR